MKSEVEQCRSEKRHVLEEFMPIKSILDEEGGVKLEKDCKDKMNWMSSAQLWSDNYSDDNNKNNNSSKKNTVVHTTQNNNQNQFFFLAFLLN